ncbi:MAG: DNA-3-methyladenine glycosylase [Betaproteobacteria bacterium RIFCSPLOWO2_02_FULL_62_79]|nr:MAG: DNA-3-methyladenine glycosylase [Betaproteobacteria bacterium RIFCSPLOWO2_02_FULL_62_79]
MTPQYWKQATRDLAARDAVLKKLIAKANGLALGSRGDAFATLARAIVGQQISVKAAQSVWGRLTAELVALTPAAIVRADAAQLRGCGLSGQKVTYLQDLAARFHSGAFDVATWSQLDDEALIDELTEVKGIGRWTAEMFLIFYMARPDVLPLDDIGLQRAIRLSYNHGKPLSRFKMRNIGNRWAPWRSVATWYLWRSLDPIPVEY